MGPAFARKYNTLLVAGTTAIQIPIIKRGAVDYAVGADWTPAAGDVKVSIDGGAAANITNLPTALAMGNTAYWIFILTAAELTGKQIVVTVSDSATKAVEDQCFIVETFGNASAMYPVDFADAARMGMTALPNAVPGAAGGLVIAGSNADTTFATLTVSGAVTFGSTWTISGYTLFNSGVTMSAAGPNQPGLQLDGFGSGAGLQLTGGTTGAGIQVSGGVSASDAVYVAGDMTVTGTTTMTGVVTMTAGLTANITGNLSGSVGSVTAAVTANVTKWNGVNVAAPNVTGVPIVDIGYLNGTAASASSGALDANLTKINGTNIATPATAGILEVNVKNINNVAAATPGAAGGVLIAGSNAATTLATFTVSGATAFTGAVTMPAGLAANIAGNLSGSVGSVTGLTTTTIWATAVPGAFASGTAGKILGDSGGTLATISSGITTIGSGITTILAALGAITGSGANTLLGYFKAVLSKTATLPSDIGGTFSPTTDSQEALSEAVATAISDIGGISGGGGGGGITLIAGVVVTGTSTTTFTASGSDLLAVSGAYNGQFLRFDDGALTGERRTILTSTYLAGVTTFTFASNQAFTVAPTTGDNFGIG